MFLLLSALQKLIPRVNDDEGEKEETDSASIASSISRRRKQTDVETMSRASQRSLQSAEIASVGYNSDQEDDDYVHIYNSEYSFGAESCAVSDRASSRGFHWSSSKQSLTSLLETLHEDGVEGSEFGCQIQESSAYDGLSINCNDEWDDYEVIEVHEKADEDKAHGLLEDDWPARKHAIASVKIDGAMSMPQGAFENVVDKEVDQDEGKVACKNKEIQSTKGGKTESEVAVDEGHKRRIEETISSSEENGIVEANPTAKQNSEREEEVERNPALEESVILKNAVENTKADKFFTESYTCDDEIEVQEVTLEDIMIENLLEAEESLNDKEWCLAVNDNLNEMAGGDQVSKEAVKNIHKGSKLEVDKIKDAISPEKFVDKEEPIEYLKNIRNLDTIRFEEATYLLEDTNSNSNSNEEVNTLSTKEEIKPCMLQSDNAIQKDLRDEGSISTAPACVGSDENMSLHSTCLGQEKVKAHDSCNSVHIEEKYSTAASEISLNNAIAFASKSNRIPTDDPKYSNKAAIFGSDEFNMSSSNKDLSIASLEAFEEIGAVKSESYITQINNASHCESKRQCIADVVSTEEVNIASMDYTETDVFDRIAPLSEHCIQQKIEQNAESDEMIVDNISCSDNSEILKIHLRDLVLDNCKEQEESIYEKKYCSIMKIFQDEMLECDEETITNSDHQEVSNMEVEEVVDRIAELGEYSIQQKEEDDTKADEMFADNLNFCDSSEIQKIHLEDLVIDYVKKTDESIYSKRRCSVVNSCQDETLDCQEELNETVESVLDNQKSSKIEVEEAIDRTAELDECSIQQTVVNYAKPDEMYADSLNYCENSEIKDLEDLEIDYVIENEESIYEKERCSFVSSCQGEIFECKEEPIKIVEIALDQNKGSIKVEEIVDRLAVLDECSIQQRVEHNAKADEMFADSFNCCENSEIQEIYLEDLVIDCVKENKESIYDKERCSVVNSYQDELPEYEEGPITTLEIVLGLQKGSKMEVDEFKTAFSPKELLDSEEICKNQISVKTLDTECHKQETHFYEKPEDIIGKSQGFKAIVDECDPKPDKLQVETTNDKILQKEGSIVEVPLYTNVDECLSLSHTVLEKEQSDKEEHIARTVNETKSFKSGRKESNPGPPSPVSTDHTAFSRRAPSLKSDEIKVSKSKDKSIIPSLEMFEKNGDIDKRESFMSYNFEMSSNTDEKEQSSNAGLFQQEAYIKTYTALKIEDEVKSANQMDESEDDHTAAMIGTEFKAVANEQADLNNNIAQYKVSEEADEESLTKQRDFGDQDIAIEDDTFEEKKLKHQEDVKANNDIHFHIPYATIAKQGVDDATAKVKCGGEEKEAASFASESYNYLFSSPTVARTLPSYCSAEHLVQGSDNFHRIETALNQKQDMIIEQEESCLPLEEPLVNSQQECECKTDISRNSEADSAANNSETEVFATELIDKDSPEEHCNNPIEDNRENMAATSKVELMASVAQDIAISTQETNDTQNKHREYNGVSVEEYLESNSQTLTHYPGLYSSVLLENQHFNGINYSSQSPQFDILPEQLPETIVENIKKYIYLDSSSTSSSNQVILGQEKKERSSQFGSQLDESYFEVCSNNYRKNFGSIGVIAEEKLSLELGIEMATDTQNKAEKRKGEDIDSEANDEEHDQNPSGRLELQRRKKAVEEADFDIMSHENATRVGLDIVSDNKGNSINEIDKREFTKEVTVEEYLKDNAISFEGQNNDATDASTNQKSGVSDHRIFDEDQDDTKDLAAEVHHENDVTVEEYLMNHSKLFVEDCNNMESGPKEDLLLKDQGNQKTNDNLYQNLYQNSEILVDDLPKGNKETDISFDVNKERGEDEAGIFLGRASNIELNVSKNVDETNDIKFQDSQVQEAITDNVSKTSENIATSEPIHEASDIDPCFDKEEKQEDLLSKSPFRKLSLEVGKDALSGTLDLEEKKVLLEEGPDVELNNMIDDVFSNEDREPALGESRDEREIRKEKGKTIENVNKVEAQVQNKCKFQQETFIKNEAVSNQQENYLKGEELPPEVQSSSFVETDLINQAKPREFSDGVSSANAKDALSSLAISYEGELTGRTLCHLSQDKASGKCDAEENVKEDESYSSGPSKLQQTMTVVDATDVLNIDVEVKIENRVTGASCDDIAVNSNTIEDLPQHLQLQRHFEVPICCVAPQENSIGGLNVNSRKAEEEQIENGCEEAGSDVTAVKGSDEECEEKKDRTSFITLLNDYGQMVLPEKTGQKVIDEIAADAEEYPPHVCFRKESQSAISLKEASGTASVVEKCDIIGQDCRKEIVTTEGRQSKMDWEAKDIQHNNETRKEAHAVEKLITHIKWPTDETVLFDDADSHTDKVEDSFSKHNGSFEKKPTFEALDRDGKDCTLLSQVSPALSELNASFSLQFEKELTLNVNEKDKTFSSDVKTSVTCDVNSEQKVGKATSNESNDVLQDHLTIWVAEGNKSRTKKSQLLIPGIRNNYYKAGTKGSKSVTCLRISGSGTKRILTGLQTTKGSEKSREKGKISYLTEEETIPSKVQQENKVVLKKVTSRVNIRASNVSHIELKDKQQPDPKFAADENEASMQTKDRTSSGDSDYKKEQVKPKRLYIRQKAFDKYSFQHSVEEPGVHGTDLSHRFEMNRTDSEKLIEEGFQVPFHAPDTIAKVLTNAVSTDDPEVGADITVIYNPRTEESCISTKQESEERDIAGIESYVVLDNEDIYANEEHCENDISSKTEAHDRNKTSKKRGGWKNKAKVQKESQIKRKKSMKERRDRLQSDENENDVFNDAITDLDMDAFDTGVESAWNTDIDQDTLVNESFEQIIVDQKERASKDICDTSQTLEGNDFDFEIVTKPVMTDEVEAESDFSIGISEDESVTVVMSFDKKLNLLRAIPPTLAPPKPTSGYSSEVEDDDETDEVVPRKKKIWRSYHEATANQDEDKQEKFPRRKKSQETPDEKEMRNKIESETAAEKYADKKSEVWKNSQILEYEVDWETPLNEEASDKVIVDPETNIIKIGLRKGMIKGSRVWDKDSQEYKNQCGIVNIKLNTGSERETNQGANVEEMPVVFMESDRKLESNTPEKELFRREFGRAGNSDEDAKEKDADNESNSNESLDGRRKGVVKDIKEQKVKEKSSPGESLRERRARERKESALQDKEEESISRESLRERRQKTEEKVAEKERKEEVSLGESLRERRIRKGEGAKQPDEEEDSSSKGSLLERRQKAEEKATIKEEKGCLNENLTERTREGKGAKYQDGEEEINSKGSLRERRQRAVEAEKRNETKSETNFGKDLQEREEKERNAAKQQTKKEKSSMGMLQKRAEGEAKDVIEKERNEKVITKRTIDKANLNAKEDSSPKEGLRECNEKKEVIDSQQKIGASKGGLPGKQNGDEQDKRQQQISQRENISTQASKAGNDGKGNTDANVVSMGEESSGICLKEGKAQEKCEEEGGSTQIMNDARDSGTSKSSDGKIAEEIIEDIKGEVSQYALNEELPNSFSDILEQNAGNDKGATNSKVVNGGKEEKIQLNDNAISSAASAKNPEIMAVVETMLKTNLPTEHKPETAEWLENVRLKETGFIEKEVTGKSSIHEKITLENAFDEKLLADAEALQYWDRILEIKRMRRLIVQKRKELAAKSAENIEADAHSLANDGEHVDDNMIQSVPNSSCGAEIDCSTDSNTCKESSHSTKELMEKQLPKSLSPEQEKRVRESDFQQEIERLQARNVETEIGKQGDTMNEEVAVKPDSSKNISRDTLAEPQNSTEENSLHQSKENLIERSSEQARKEEVNSKSKAKKRGKSKAESKGARDHDETAKKVPLIQITEPSTEVFFDSEELELDEDDENFIEEVLKQLEERKRERKKQRELEELEELRMQSRKKKATIDEDDLDMEVLSATSESDKDKISAEDQSQRSEHEVKELKSDLEEQEVLENGNGSKQTRINDRVDGKERRRERIFNEDNDKAKMLKNKEVSTKVVNKEELYSRETFENQNASKRRRKKRTSDEDHEDELLEINESGERDTFLKGDSVSENVKNQSSIAVVDSRERSHRGRRGKSAEGDEDHEAKRNYDESPVSRAKVRTNDNNVDDSVSREMINKEKIENETISQKTPPKDEETEESMSSPKRRRKRHDEKQEKQGKEDQTFRRLRGSEKESKMADIASSSMISEEKKDLKAGEAMQFVSRESNDSTVENNEENMQRREIRDNGEVEKEHEKTGSRNVRRRIAEGGDKESSSIGREDEITDVSREQSNMDKKLLEDKLMPSREKENGNNRRKEVKRREKVKGVGKDKEHSEVEEAKSKVYQPEESEEELLTNMMTRNRSFQQDAAGDSDASWPILDHSRGGNEESLKNNKKSTAKRERRSAQDIPKEEDVKNESESSDSIHCRYRGRGEKDEETKRRPRKQKMYEGDNELTRDQENESKDGYSEREKTRRRARSRRYEEELDGNPQSLDQNTEVKSKEKERRILRRNHRKERDQIDDSIFDSSDTTEHPRERRRRTRIESDSDESALENGSSKTGAIGNESIDENFMDEDITSSDVKTHVKSARMREKARHDGEKDTMLMKDSSKVEERAEDTPIQRRRRERRSKQGNQSTEDEISANKEDLNDISRKSGEEKDQRKDKYNRNEAPVNRESETEAADEKQTIPGGRKRRRRKQLDEESEVDAIPRARRERKRGDNEEEANLASSTGTNRTLKQGHRKDRDVQEKNEVIPSYDREMDRLKDSARKRVQRLPETSKNDSVKGKEFHDENDRQDRHRKKRNAFADNEKLRASQEYDEEMVGVLRSPSSRNEWKGAGSDRSDVESKSESERGEAEDGSSNKELDKSVNEQIDDGKLIGSRRRSSCRNEWKNEGETSRMEREVSSSSQKDFLGEEDFQGNRSTYKDSKSTTSDSRKDQQLHVTKKRLKHGSKESLEQMIGSIRSSSTRDEWKEIFKSQSQP